MNVQDPIVKKANNILADYTPDELAGAFFRAVNYIASNNVSPDQSKLSQMETVYEQEIRFDWMRGLLEDVRQIQSKEVY